MTSRILLLLVLVTLVQWPAAEGGEVCYRYRGHRGSSSSDEDSSHGSSEHRSRESDSPEFPTHDEDDSWDDDDDWDDGDDWNDDDDSDDDDSHEMKAGWKHGLGSKWMKRLKGIKMTYCKHGCCGKLGRQRCCEHSNRLIIGAVALSLALLVIAIVIGFLIYKKVRKGHRIIKPGTVTVISEKPPLPAVTESSGTLPTKPDSSITTPPNYEEVYTQPTGEWSPPAYDTLSVHNVDLDALPAGDRKANSLPPISTFKE